MTADQQAAGGEVATQDRKAELERVQDLPLAPSLVNSRELASLSAMAKAYSQMPGLAPAYKGKPDAVMAALLTAHSLDLPINPVVVNQFYDVNGRLFPSTQIVIALAARQGVEVWFDDGCNETWAKAYCRRRGDERVHSYEYTLEMAKKAKLASKDVWQQHPEIMLRYRASSRLLRTVAADVVLGVPSTIMDGDVGIAPVSRERLESRAEAITVDDDDIVDGELVHCSTPGCTIDEPHRHDPAVADRPPLNYDERPFTDDAA